MMKRTFFFSLLLNSALHGAASPSVSVEYLEREIERAIKTGDPVVGIVENLERLAMLYDAKGDVLGQLKALSRISGLKGYSKEKKVVNDVRVTSMFGSLEKRFKAQAGQLEDMRAHFYAQLMLGRLYLARNAPGDKDLAQFFLKAAAKQTEYLDVLYEAYIALGDLYVADSFDLAKSYYDLVPKENALWVLAQAKLGMLLIKRAEHEASEKDKEELFGRAGPFLANGVAALADASFSFDDRMKATYLAARQLQLNDRWQEAAKYFFEVANNSLSPEEKFRANFDIALVLQRTQPFLAPIYFKRIYEQNSPIKEIDPMVQMFGRMIAAKELASLELDREQLSPHFIEYLQFAVKQAGSLVDFSVKNKQLINNKKRVIRNFLTGSFGLGSVIDRAGQKSSDNENFVVELGKIRVAFEKLDRLLDELEERGIEV